MGKRLTLEDNSGEQSTGEKVGKGAYIKTGVITSIEDQSNYPGQETKYYAKNGNPRELFLVISFKTDDYEHQLFLYGRFKRNSKGLITAWDSWNNNVQRLLTKLLGKEAQIEEDLSIPKDVLDKLVGKEFKYVNYISNGTYENKKGETKNNYQVWNKIFTVEQAIEEITEEWNNNLQWTNDYSPESLQNYDSKNDPWNEKKPESNTVMSSDTTQQDSDDSII